MIPYVTPTDLLGNPSAPPTVTTPSDAATLGVNFGMIDPTRVLEMCHVATSMCDSVAGLELRATSFYEELSAPGHRVGFINDTTARFITSRKPILSVVSGQASYGGPPWNWNVIPIANIVPEETPFADFGTASWNSATSGQAAILIGQSSVGWGAGRQGMRVGLRYISGWPVAGITPSATPTGTTTSGTDSVTGVSSLTGVTDGATIAGPGIPTGTTILSASGTTITMSATATASATITLTIGYAPGVTVLNVDDTTAWTLGVRGTIYDGQSTETVTSTLATPTTSGLPTPAGPGTVTLAAPTIFAHAPGVALSAMPDRIRWAAMLHCKIQALERGAPGITAQGVPGRSSNSAGSASSALMKTIEDLLRPYRRVF